MSKHTDNSENEQRPMFITDDLLTWLTAGWLDVHDPVRTIRGDDDIRWSDARDDGDDDYPYTTPRHLRREVA